MGKKGKDGFKTYSPNSYATAAGFCWVFFLAWFAVARFDMGLGPVLLFGLPALYLTFRCRAAVKERGRRGTWNWLHGYRMSTTGK